MHSEAQTMKFIFRNVLKVPVPEVLKFDTGFDNAIVAPYILMWAVGGKPAQYLCVPADRKGIPTTGKTTYLAEVFS